MTLIKLHKSGFFNVKKYFKIFFILGAYFLVFLYLYKYKEFFIKTFSEGRRLKKCMKQRNG